MNMGISRQPSGKSSLVVGRWPSVFGLRSSAKAPKVICLQFIQTQKCSGDAAGALALPDG